MVTKHEHVFVYKTYVILGGVVFYIYECKSCPEIRKVKVGLR